LAAGIPADRDDRGNCLGTDDNYLTDLIRSAREARLSEQRYWHLLLHYREDSGG